MKRKLLSVILTLCIVLGMLPTVVFAQDSAAPPEDVTVINPGPVINLCGVTLNKTAAPTDKPDVFKITLKADIPKRLASALATVLMDRVIPEEEDMACQAAAKEAAKKDCRAAVIIDPMSEFVTLNKDSLPQGMTSWPGEDAIWWKLDTAEENFNTYTLDYYVTVKTEFCNGKFYPTNYPTTLTIPPQNPCDAPIVIYFPIPTVKVNQVTVTYTDGAEGEDIFEDQVYDVNYGADTPAFDNGSGGDKPVRIGYVFAGWEPEVAAKATEDAVYAAKWDPATDTAYEVEHYLQNIDGNDYALKHTDSLTGTTGAKITAVDYIKDFTGFTFEKADPERTAIAPDGSTVLRLYYTRNSYCVVYVYDGKVPADAAELPGPKIYKYEEKVTVAPDAEAKGYTFGGWSSEDAQIGEDGSFTMPANDVTITGSWSANEYTITYTIDGEPYEIQTYHYEDPVTPPDYEVPKDYKFSGWKVPDTMPAEDLVVDAILEKILIQTGQLNWPIPVLGGLGLLLLGFGIYNVTRKRKNKYA